MLICRNLNHDRGRLAVFAGALAVGVTIAGCDSDSAGDDAAAVSTEDPGSSAVSSQGPTAT